MIMSVNLDRFLTVSQPAFEVMASSASGTKVTVFLEVEGAAHYLPAYAGNLDIMTSAALKTAERIIEMRSQEMNV